MTDGRVSALFALHYQTARDLDVLPAFRAQLRHGLQQLEAQGYYATSD